MLTYILIGLAIVVVLFLIVVAMQPAQFRVERSATLSASPPAVFSQVNDFHKWDAWSPWAKRDPAMKQTYDGPPAGAGAIYSWEGNREVGAGRMTITESRPDELIRIKLEFFKPFPGVNDVEFTFKPAGDQTTVNWRMTGQKNFMMKGAGLFMNMDKLIGGDFEKGLAGIKTVAETAMRR